MVNLRPLKNRVSHGNPQNPFIPWNIFIAADIVDIQHGCLSIISGREVPKVVEVEVELEMAGVEVMGGVNRFC
ncbi:hypothetical protein [Methylomonas sp. AM2-LC]|uniref:hypothetical protein n=1 Tax=Methylomonas sp. AM2-LC TaxID=3153301 RepID=UPI003265CA08